MTFAMPYFSGNLLQRNWDAITAAFAGVGNLRLLNNFALSGALPAVGSELITVYRNNGGAALTVTLADPVAGTDDGKLVVITLQSGNGSTLQTTNADFTEDSTAPVGDACVVLIAVTGSWQIIVALGVTVV